VQIFSLRQEQHISAVPAFDIWLLLSKYSTSVHVGRRKKTMKDAYWDDLIAFVKYTHSKGYVPEEHIVSLSDKLCQHMTDKAESDESASMGSTLLCQNDTK
jgi:hypothetical protein